MGEGVAVGVGVAVGRGVAVGDGVGEGNSRPRTAPGDVQARAQSPTLAIIQAQRCAMAVSGAEDSPWWAPRQWPLLLG